MKLTNFFAGAALVLLSGCSTPVWQQIKNTVATDIGNGVILGDIETAVAAFDPALATVAGAIDSLIQLIIDDLEANGSLTPAQVASAEAVKAQIKAKLVTLGAADRALLRDRTELTTSPAVARLVARELAR